jgi:hypothetical protein
VFENRLIDEEKISAREGERASDRRMEKTA